MQKLDVFNWMQYQFSMENFVVSLSWKTKENQISLERVVFNELCNSNKLFTGKWKNLPVNHREKPQSSHLQ